MANPKRRHSHARQGTRRAHHSLTSPLLDDCPKCHEKKLPHHVCPKCGFYKGRRVIAVKETK